MPLSVRQKLGALALDVPRYAWHLRGSPIRICNRNERLRVSPDGVGVECQWQWASDLHAAEVFPSLGRRLMHRHIADWPIAFDSAPKDGSEDCGVSFVIGHRGAERIPQLMATLGTIAAQQGVACECIVVEQDLHARLEKQLPGWVRYVHTLLPSANMPYSRAWALNTGARVANGKVLIFHDNDLLVPIAYAREVWRRYSDGFEVVNLKRFIFYLDSDNSREIQKTRSISSSCVPETVTQNTEGGGSIAVSREAFFAIGGFDESFVGWGGEDNEFWERAATRKGWTYGYLPLVHLWHQPQPNKADIRNPNMAHYKDLSAISPELRIRALVKREFGQMQTTPLPFQPNGNRDIA